MGEVELAALRKNREARERLDAERDDLIVAAKLARTPVTHIADAVGLSATHVHRIINERGVGPSNSPKEQYREQVAAEEADNWGEGALRDLHDFD